MKEGDLISRRYELVRWIARGGMGSVWQAIDHRLEDRPVAIKLLELTEVPREEAAQMVYRFRLEARTAATLDSPHIAMIHDYGEDGDLCYIVQEFIPSKSVAAILDDQAGLHDLEIAEIGSQASRGLAHIHEHRFVHRDIKPSNILVRDSDRIVKLIDFGIAQGVNHPKLTATGAVIGTVSYLSREVSLGLRAVPASDVFSLGSTLYCMLEGVPPFGDSTNLYQTLNRIGNNLIRPVQRQSPLTPLVLSMLAANSTDRPTAHDVDATLTALKSRLPRTHRK